MKTNLVIFSILFTICSCTNGPKAEWTTTTELQPWSTNESLDACTISSEKVADVTINVDDTKQTIEGFGACFNELGWTSLSELDEVSREEIMNELFTPGVGANFNICRMPVGANDFSIDWYSYNETDKDFEMKNFSIENDKKTLIPFINSALKYQPSLRLWASPWAPPSWMKHNNHYAMAYTDQTIDEKYRNGLEKNKIGYEGVDMFIQEPKYLEAYALYFSKFIKAYKDEGINIFAVMPQNEFNSAQIFPSCCWTSKSLTNFIGNYLGPVMKKDGVEVMFGTMERANKMLVDTILTDTASSKYINCIGFQWAGKGAISEIHKEYPNLKLYQTEQECGDGKNSWDGAMYSWNLMRHYMNNGTSAYMYWNISLSDGGISRWGWAQNSLVVVDTTAHTFKYTPEYYVMKHASHYVKSGAKRISTDGIFSNLLAFKNPDNSIVIIMVNDSDEENEVSIKVKDSVYIPLLKANSISTLLIK